MFGVATASKGAVLSLTLALAADEVTHGIRVNCVSPAICYLAADTTFTTGADFLLDGGIASMRVVG